MKILVTGGAGFIGSHLVDTLIEQGHCVIIIDNLSTGKIKNINIKKLNKTGGKFYNINICDKDQLNTIFVSEKPTIIFHLAAISSIARSIEDPLETHSSNVNGTLNIFDMARKYNIEKVIYASSASVYGEQKIPQVKETMISSPLSLYALHKSINEQYAQIYSRLFGMQFIGLRYFNVYGRRQSLQGEYTPVIPKFIEQKRQKKGLTIYGDGNQTRAFIHVSDVVRANIMAMESKQKSCDIFNVGTDKQTSIKKLAQIIGGRVSHTKINPRSKFDIKYNYAHIGRIDNILGWRPKITIQQGIKQLLKVL